MNGIGSGEIAITTTSSDENDNDWVKPHLKRPGSPNLEAFDQMNSDNEEEPLTLHFTGSPKPSEGNKSPFPQKIIAFFGEESFSKIPFQDLSKRRIVEIALDNFNGPSFCFLNSQEGDMGVAFLKNHTNIEVYHGKTQRVENWFFTTFSLNEVNKNINSSSRSSLLLTKLHN